MANESEQRTGWVSKLKGLAVHLLRRRWLLAGAAAVVVVLSGGAVWFGANFAGSDEGNTTHQKQIAGQLDNDNTAVQAGKQLTNNKCSGTGPAELTALPMRSDDFAFIIPYGLVIGSHVTPIDHQYFSPADFNSSPDAYPVYAMADGRITEISHRKRSVSEPGKPANDYRFVFSHTCTFLTYFDLVTSLAPDIQAEFDKAVRDSGGQEYAPLDIPVEAGQLVGYIGGQTLDFAVWDTEQPLDGFVSPELYSPAEPWKIYTVDPLDYYADGVKSTVLAKYLRDGNGASGKIDWDQDGRLIGNWFQEGTNGYMGDRDAPDGRYWRGHLSFAPNHLDPGEYIASFGTFAEPGDGLQYLIVSGGPTPADVTTGTGLVKYQLQRYSYLTSEGELWDRLTFTRNPIIVPNTQEPTAGCVLVELLEPRRLRAETFPGQTCSAATGFTSRATVYVR